MSFAPGQFITAQRLNRLQSKTYWASASSNTAASMTSVDIPGASIPITTETDGATMAISWSAAVYALSSAMTTNCNVRALIGADVAPVFALADWRTANDKGTVANFWAATVTTAGAYTVKLQGTTPANANIQVYSSIMVTVHEVA